MLVASKRKEITRKKYFSVLVLRDLAKQLAVMGKIYKPKNKLFRSSRP